ncbi:MAG: YbbC/YhhH family protein [Acidobacteriia bacterium]|nr:YbbC/YhhH family protein [Terriglobia bacterium]
MKTLFLFVAVLLVSIVSSYSQAAPPAQNLVPDSETAIALAKVILKPIYGVDFLKKKIFSAEEREGVWTVIGKSKIPPGKIAIGGVVELRINATDARIAYLHLSL